MNKVIIICFLLTICTLIQAQTKSTAKPIPNGKVKDTNGKMVNLSTYTQAGKITIVSFWATWCGPCKLELDAYKSHFDDWNKKYGVQFLAISIDDFRGQAKVNPLVTQKGWPYTILLDSNSDMQRQLGFNSIPQLYLLDKKGNIVYQASGYEKGSEQELENKMENLK